MTQATSA